MEKFAQRVRPPLAMQSLLFTPPGMIVRPPARLEQMFRTPIAKSVRSGSILRRYGSILSTAAIVASDSTPSIITSVNTVATTAQTSERSANTPAKSGSTIPCLRMLSGTRIRSDEWSPSTLARIMPTKTTASGAGTLRSHPDFARPTTNIIARPINPIRKTRGCMWPNSTGASRM